MKREECRKRTMRKSEGAADAATSALLTWSDVSRKTGRPVTTIRIAGRDRLESNPDASAKEKGRRRGTALDPA
jgi:hypothetical protein